MDALTTTTMAEAKIDGILYNNDNRAKLSIDSSHLLNDLFMYRVSLSEEDRLLYVEAYLPFLLAAII